MTGSPKTRPLCALYAPSMRPLCASMRGLRPGVISGPGSPWPRRCGELFSCCAPPPLLWLRPCVFPAPGALGLGAVAGCCLAAPPPPGLSCALWPWCCVLVAPGPGLWRRVGLFPSCVAPPPFFCLFSRPLSPSAPACCSSGPGCPVLCGGVPCRVPLCFCVSSCVVLLALLSGSVRCCVVSLVWCGALWCPASSCVAPWFVLRFVWCCAMLCWRACFLPSGLLLRLVVLLVLSPAVWRCRVPCFFFLVLCFVVSWCAVLFGAALCRVVLCCLCGVVVLCAPRLLLPVLCGVLRLVAL